MTIVIYGPCRTKKTSNRVLRFGRFNKIVPSEAYLHWRDSAVTQMRVAWAGHETVDRPVSVRATFYRDANRGDLIGYMQGLADALQEAGVLKDDKWIVSWDGTRLSKDANRPRVEVDIEEVT